MSSTSNDQYGEMTPGGVRPLLPVKRWAFGMSTCTLAPPHHTWFYFCHQQTFDTEAEARKLMDTRKWRHPSAHDHSGIAELSDEQIAAYNEFWAECHICKSKPYQPTDAKRFCSRCGNQPTMIPSPSAISNPELQAIFNKHHCDRPIPDGINPFRLDEETQATWDARACQLKDKWAARIEPNWYGFEINNVPPNWLDAIDDALDYVQSVRADFTIKQVKLKFGGIRMYLNFYTGDTAGQQLHKDLAEFSTSFNDPKLVW